MPTEIKPFVESNDVLDQPDMLRARAKRDGYLFFRNLIDPHRGSSTSSRFSRNLR